MAIASGTDRAGAVRVLVGRVAAGEAGHVFLGSADLHSLALALAFLCHRHPSLLSLSSWPGRAATGPPASPSSSQHERTLLAPTSSVSTTPSSDCQPHHLFRRPMLIPSTLAPLGLQYHSHFPLAIAEWPPGDPA